MALAFGRFFVAGTVVASLLSSTGALAVEPFEPGWRFNPPPGVHVRTAVPRPAVVVQAIPQVSSIYVRQVVSYSTSESAGTIIVDSRAHFLYYVLGNGQAVRYGIGVARDGFEWSGTHRVTRKAEWPSWTPPAEMRQRQPYLPAYMEGGPGNPMGARALYLGSTLYRIHGTVEPWTIGQNVSSGCIRMTNEDVIDLYGRVQVSTKVVVF
jgi:lipoprotein-anchoring transpeptidase ErfK/SrfK